MDPNDSVTEDPEQRPTTSSNAAMAVPIRRTELKRKYIKEEMTSSQFYTEMLKIERERNEIKKQKMENKNKFYEDKLRILRLRFQVEEPNDALVNAVNDM